MSKSPLKSLLGATFLKEEKSSRILRSTEEADSLNTLSAPLNKREKLLAMTDAEFELYEQRLLDEQARINNNEFQKHLMLVTNQN